MTTHAASSPGYPPMIRHVFTIATHPKTGADLARCGELATSSARACAARDLARRLVAAGEADGPIEANRNSWSPRIVAGLYDTIKPDYSNPMEAKSIRMQPSGNNATDKRVIAFGAGISVFAIGVILLLIHLFTKNDNFKLGASALLAVGSVTTALALLRGQTDDERGA